MHASIRGRSTLLFGLLALAIALLTTATAAAASDPFDLVPGTAVLADNFSSGNGGNTSSTTSSTNIFSPSVFVDYNRFGDNLGCGPDIGAIDDRQWDAVDEYYPGDAPPTTGHVYVSFINFTTAAAPTLSLERSLHDGAPGTFVTDSVCDTLNGQIPTIITSPSPCPDPLDKDLQVAGPPVVDIYNTHNVYIPF